MRDGMAETANWSFGSLGDVDDEFLSLTLWILEDDC